MNDEFDAEQTSRSIFQSARTASLGTLDEDAAPFVSLVTIAQHQGALVMLLSGLAIHTKNLKRDPRCSLLIVQGGGEQGDPLVGARLTIRGQAIRIERADDGAERNAFLRRHESAAMYADFGDFAFYRVEVTTAHLVAGFGRIVTLSPDVFAK